MTDPQGPAGDGRTVWVTGAAGGMGASHARRFAGRGDRVGCWDVDAEALKAVVGEIQTGGGTAVPAIADVTDWQAVQAAAAGVREALGPASVVIANAGVLPSGEHVRELDPEAWRRVIDVNLTGAFLTAKAAIPQLRETGGGSLILISSVCGLTASAGYAAYNASKHGVIGLMRTLAHELGDAGITVNAVCPGWVRTPMLDQSLEAGRDAGSSPEDYARMGLIERLVEPEEVTDAVEWLASPGARMVTAVALPLDGGLMEQRAWPPEEGEIRPPPPAPSA
jgi:2-dehydro-3-deoxy-L-rhamnonate dehydrogenase (NAD+)